jgi:hypothetical protein
VIRVNTYLCGIRLRPVGDAQEGLQNRVQCVHVIRNVEMYQHSFVMQVDPRSRNVLCSPETSSAPPSRW